MRRASLVSAAVLLALVQPVALSQEKTDPAPLTVRLEKGDVLRFVSTIEGSQTFDLGALKLEQSYEFLKEFTLEVMRRRDDGAYEMALTYGRIRGEINAPPAMESKFDSNDPPVGNDIGAVTGRLLTAQSGMKIGLSMDATGRLQDFTGLDEARERIGTDDPAVAAAIAQIITEEKLRQELSWFLFAAPYPASGSAMWTATKRVPGTSDAVLVDVALEHSVTERTANSVVVTTEGAPKASGGKGSRLPLDKAEDTGSKLTATTRLRAADGLPDDVSMELRLALDIPNPRANWPAMTLEQTSMMRLQRVQKFDQPAGAKAPPEDR